MRSGALPVSVDRTDTPLAARFRALGRACGLAVLVLGGLVLLGWAFDVVLLKGVVPGLVTMKANTAAGFMLGGAALRLLAGERDGPGRRAAAQACAGAIVLLGALTLAEHLVGWDLRIDQVLFRSAPGAADTAAPGRMAPETASIFLLLGVALLLLDTETRGGHRPAQALALLAGLAAVLALLGYLYGVGGSMRMALHTAAGFFLLSTGVIAARPEGGGMALLTGDSVGGVMLRRLAALLVLLPVALGWLRLEGERAGLFGLGTGLALFAFANVVILSALLDVGAQAMDRVEAQRRKADALFRALAESTPDAVALVDRSGVIRLVNAQAERLFGYERGALLDQPIELLIPERFRRAHTEHRREYTAAPRPRAMGGLDLYGLRRDGSEFPVEISLNPLETEGDPHVAAIVRDVSERKQAESALACTAQDLARSNREGEKLTSSLRAAKQRLRALSHRLLELQEAERRHLARELHDQLGQSITAIKLNLEAALRFPDGPGLDKHLSEAVSLLERLLSDVRSLSLQLRPALLDELGLDAAIRSLVEQQAGRAGLTFRFEALRPPGRLDNDLEAACFRVAQEAVSNALRHSRAKSLGVALWLEGEQLHLGVSDDGTGFDLDEVHRRVDSSPGFGLVSMEERALLAGGQLTIRTRPGAGTEVHAVFPTSPAGPRKRSGEVPRQ